MKKIGEVLIDDLKYNLWGKIWTYKDEKYVSIFFNVPDNIFKDIKDTLTEICSSEKINFKVRYKCDPYRRIYAKIYIVNILENINSILQKLKNLKYKNIKFTISKDFSIVIEDEIIKKL